MSLNKDPLDDYPPYTFDNWKNTCDILYEIQINNNNNRDDYNNNRDNYNTTNNNTNHNINNHTDSKDINILERYFIKYLPQSTNIDFYLYYISYINKKDINHIEAYEYVIKNLLYHYNVDEIIFEYINKFNMHEEYRKDNISGRDKRDRREYNKDYNRTNNKNTNKDYNINNISSNILSLIDSILEQPVNNHDKIAAIFKKEINNKLINILKNKIGKIDLRNIEYNKFIELLDIEYNYYMENINDNTYDSTYDYNRILFYIDYLIERFYYKYETYYIAYRITKHKKYLLKGIDNTIAYKHNMCYQDKHNVYYRNNIFLLFYISLTEDNISGLYLKKIEELYSYYNDSISDMGDDKESGNGNGGIRSGNDDNKKNITNNTTNNNTTTTTTNSPINNIIITLNKILNKKIDNYFINEQLTLLIINLFSYINRTMGISAVYKIYNGINKINNIFIMHYIKDYLSYLCYYTEGNKEEALKITENKEEFLLRIGEEENIGNYIHDVGDMHGIGDVGDKRDRRDISGDNKNDNGNNNINNTTNNHIKHINNHIKHNNMYTYEYKYKYGLNVSDSLIMNYTKNNNTIEDSIRMYNNIFSTVDDNIYNISIYDIISSIRLYHKMFDYEELKIRSLLEIEIFNEEINKDRIREGIRRDNKLCKVDRKREEVTRFIVKEEHNIFQNIDDIVYFLKRI